MFFIQLFFFVKIDFVYLFSIYFYLDGEIKTTNADE